MDASMPAGQNPAVTPLERHVLERVLSGQKKPDEIASALLMPKDAAVKMLDRMAGDGLVTVKKSFLSVTYEATDTGRQLLSVPKPELDVLRESAMARSGAYSKLTVTVRNTGIGLLENARVEVSAPKNFTILRAGSALGESADERHCTANLAFLPGGEGVVLVFTFTATLPAGVASNKYSLRVELKSKDDAVLERKETSVYIEAAETLLGGGATGFSRLTPNTPKNVPGVV